MVQTPDNEGDGDRLRLTTKVAASYVGHNQVALAEIPGLLKSIFQALGGTAPPDAELSAAKLPAVSIKKSVTPDFLICLEDGKRLKMLKRHLKTAYDMTPDDYRAKWNLPADYPMVALAYAQARSNMAKSIGLGRMKPAEAPAAAAPAKRGRKKAEPAV